MFVCRLGARRLGTPACPAIEKSALGGTRNCPLCRDRLLSLGGGGGRCRDELAERRLSLEIGGGLLVCGECTAVFSGSCGRSIKLTARFLLVMYFQNANRLTSHQASPLLSTPVL